MNKVEEIYENIKERLTSPLIFSYVVAWIVINWKVVVALVWWDPKQFADGNIRTIFDFIEVNTTWKNSVEMPLRYAIIYTVGYPLIKVLISGWQTFLGTLEEKLNLRINRGHKVPLSRYLALRDEQIILNQRLVQIVEEDSENRQKVIDAKESKANAERELQDANRKISDANKRTELVSAKLNAIQDPKPFEGFWIVMQPGLAKRIGVLQIQSKNIFWITKDKPAIPVGTISTFLCDTREQAIAIIVFDINQSIAATLLSQTIFNNGDNQLIILTKAINGGRNLHYQKNKYLIRQTEPKKPVDIPDLDE